jgi:hypothetical protein
MLLLGICCWVADVFFVVLEDDGSSLQCSNVHVRVCIDFKIRE